jgi:hypothetical protein
MEGKNRFIIILISFILLVIGASFFVNKLIFETIKKKKIVRILNEIFDEEKPFKSKKTDKDFILYKELKIFEFFNEKYYKKKDNEKESFLNQVSIVSQLSFERVNRLNYFIKTWEGEINVSLYMTCNKTKSEILKLIPITLLEKIKFHLVLNYKNKERIYPMNILR